MSDVDINDELLDNDNSNADATLVLVEILKLIDVLMFKRSDDRFRSSYLIKSGDIG